MGKYPYYLEQVFATRTAALARLDRLISEKGGGPLSAEITEVNVTP